MAKTHAQHMKRLADKRRRYDLVCRLFPGFVVSQRLLDRLIRDIDKIATLCGPEETPR